MNHERQSPGSQKRRWRYAGLAALLTPLLAVSWVKRERLWYTLFPSSATGSEARGATDEETRARRFTRDLRGYVVWSSNRHGNHDILMLTLPDWELRRLTTHPHPEYFPRVSPDGGRVVFARGREPRASHRKQEAWDVHVLELATGAERRIAEHATTPNWSADGNKIYYVRATDSALYEYDLASGREISLLRAGAPPMPGGVSLHEPDVSPRNDRVALTLRGATRMTALASPGGAIERVGDGCQMAWSPDGSFLYWIDHGGRGENLVWRRDVAGGAPRAWLDLPEPFSHEYFPRMSRDARLLVLGASAGGHEHDRADYELFLWRIGTPAAEAVRLTFHSGNDNWPDLFLRGK